MNPDDEQVHRKMVQADTRARAYGTVLVVLLAAFIGASLAITAFTATQVKTLAETNAASLEYGADAVNCIRYLIIEHRWVNEEYHREQADFLGIPAPKHSELEPRPTPEQTAKACARFQVQPDPPPVKKKGD